MQTTDLEQVSQLVNQALNQTKQGVRVLVGVILLGELTLGHRLWAQVGCIQPPAHWPWLHREGQPLYTVIRGFGRKVPCLPHRARCHGPNPPSPAPLPPPPAVWNPPPFKCSTVVRSGRLDQMLENRSAECVTLTQLSDI